MTVVRKHLIEIEMWMFISALSTGIMSTDKVIKIKFETTLDNVQYDYVRLYFELIPFLHM